MAHIDLVRYVASKAVATASRGGVDTLLIRFHRGIGHSARTDLVAGIRCGSADCPCRAGHHIVSANVSARQLPKHAIAYRNDFGIRAGGADQGIWSNV